MKINVIQRDDTKDESFMLEIEDSLINVKQAYIDAIGDMLEEEDFISTIPDPDADLIQEWDNEDS